MDVYEEREANRVRRNEIVEQASSNGRVPSHTCTGPGGAKDKDMDAEEERRRNVEVIVSRLRMM